MSYTLTPPSTGGTLLNTRDKIRTNFEIIQNSFEVNHSTYASGQGKHLFLQMPEQGSSPTTAANEAGFYAAEGNSVTQLFMRRESDGSLLQLTASDVTNTTAQATNGYTCLPGGLIYQWGQKSSPGTSGSVTFNKSFTGVPYVIILTIQHNSSANESATVKGDTAPTASGFSYRTTSSSANTKLNWIAIGLAS